MGDSAVLTEEAVENVRFDPARFPSRGYNEDQVDDFLDKVVASIRTLNNTVADQRREIDRLKHWRQHTGPIERQTDGWEQEARARADAIIAAARVSAEEIRRLAMVNAQRIVETDRAAVQGILRRLGALRDGLAVELGQLEDALALEG